MSLVLCLFRGNEVAEDKLEEIELLFEADVDHMAVGQNFGYLFQG